MSAATQAVTVNASNFVRAETDTYLDGILQQIGSLGRWHHLRQPTSVAEQTVIRMNRDTLYSVAIVDLSAQARLTMPDAGGRYQTAMVVNQDHYINRVYDEPGEYELTLAEFDTPFVLIGVRTLVDPSDPADIATVTDLQDRLALTADSTAVFSHPQWDGESLKATRDLLLELARNLPDTFGGFGSRDGTDPIKHLLATAAGWGGLPREQAHYIGVEPKLPVGHYALTVGAVPVRGFWSISVYNAAGFFEKNDLGRYSVNSVTAVPDGDGTVTVNFGGDAGSPNQIPIMDGWNYVVRLYQPAPEILDGTWSFPTLTA